MVRMTQKMSSALCLNMCLSHSVYSKVDGNVGLSNVKKSHKTLNKIDIQGVSSTQISEFSLSFSKLMH